MDYRKTSNKNDLRVVELRGFLICEGQTFRGRSDKLWPRGQMKLKKCAITVWPDTVKHGGILS